MQNVDIKLNVIVTGEPSVGKTSLIRRYAENKFQEEYISTVGIDFSFKTTQLNVCTSRGLQPMSVRIKLYDIGGTKSLRKSHQKLGFAMYGISHLL